jgi:hypothetical protein
MTGHTNFSGAWRLDCARSTLLGPAIAGIDMLIVHDEPRFVQRMQVTLPDGASRMTRFEGITGGAQFENANGPWRWQSAATWQGPELLIESYVDAGERKFHFRDVWFRDGAALVMQHRDGDLAGQYSRFDPAPEFAAGFA